MERKENPDNFIITAHTIINWYDQTHTTMTVARKPPSPLNSEIMGILLAAKKQTEGALTTLANKNILSTHALLRILVEIHIVLAWALNAPAKEEKTKSDDEVYKRLKSWDYKRAKNDKALLEDLPRTTEIESAIEKLKADIERYKEDGIEDFPYSYKQLYDDVFGKESAEMYAKFYRTYSRAVHLNRNVTQKLAWLEYENGEPKAVFYKDDIEADCDELLNIASISCDINKAIRSFYEWHSEAMQNEYDQIKSRLVKKE
jgi:hypothetical protein